ncbi:Amidophosphoribosyltransferase [Araneus ventricosus]|uniref:Amidophosphoribosyltransferase n=1 Tax=Araneus ventricosus TaxID=182803 RepID=A0A4Y2NU57_ARAVE|nr:Amidophosphoribosyltransferase [Araneus ventricosus]
MRIDSFVKCTVLPVIIVMHKYIHQGTEVTDAKPPEKYAGSRFPGGGQESCGIVSSNGDKHIMRTHKGSGLVNHAFKEDDLAKLKGSLGIGHTRYSTLGGTEHLNTQPFVVNMKHAKLALAHNGELVNASELRREIMERGVGLSTESDSELMIQTLCLPPPEPNNETEDNPDWPARIQNLMRRTKTAYSLLIMSGDTIYAVRDPYGLRPLCVGKIIPPTGTQEEERSSELFKPNGLPLSNGNGNVIENGYKVLPDNDDECEGYVVASESCAFPSVSGKLLREVEPGEILEITKHGLRSICIVPRSSDQKMSLCIFEYVYFARPDTYMEGQMVYTARMECGRQLAKQSPVEADVVSAVPETSTPAAIGFAEESGIAYREIFSKNRYVGRSFIQPSTRLRQLAVLKKFGPLSENFKDKRIVLIDDSIVRGTTIAAIIRMLREAGATEVHIRIASPPLHFPCYMGINIPTKEELIANKLNADQLAEQIGADSLVYLTVENLEFAVRKHANTDEKCGGHCTACLTGKYPVELEW